MSSYGEPRIRHSTPGLPREQRRNCCNVLRRSRLGLAAVLAGAEVPSSAGAVAGERRELAAALAPAERCAVRRGAQHLVELDETPVELYEL